VKKERGSRREREGREEGELARQEIGRARVRERELTFGDQPSPMAMAQTMDDFPDPLGAW